MKIVETPYQITVQANGNTTRLFMFDGRLTWDICPNSNTTDDLRLCALALMRALDVVDDRNAVNERTAEPEDIELIR